MLIRRADLERIARGEIDLAFRRWRRPSVKAGGTLTTAIGMLAIDAVERIEPSAIGTREAQRAGYASRAALLAALERPGDGEIYRITLRYLGADPRIRLRDTLPDVTELTTLRTRLERLDRAAADGAWTRRVLELIRDREGVRAAELAAELGRETAPFKRDVRKLKALGLTESLEVGYRLSPRGRALLDFLARPG
ncbi:MAG TPA: hypothetical protein VF210_01990 [Pseudomonadales bacterium]